MTEQHHNPRVEDDALLRGRGKFVDDVEKQGVANAVFVRSPYAHADIVSIATEEAAKVPGVIGILTAADLTGIGTVTRHPPIPGRGGAKIAFSHRPPLADRKVMHVGEAVAMVIAETLTAALDAAELIAVAYKELPAVIDGREALKPDAPQLYDTIPNNLALDWPGSVDDPANVAARRRLARSAGRG